MRNYGFVGFGDNAQNITKGVSMKFSDLVYHLNKVDTIEENEAASGQFARNYRELLRKRADRRSQKKELTTDSSDDAKRQKLRKLSEDELKLWEETDDLVGDVVKRGNQFFLVKIRYGKDNRDFTEEILPYKTKPCTYIQLKKNFRSHSKILALGNSIVRILEMLQRGDLDIMDDEYSDLEGPKPMVIKRGENIDTLIQLLIQSYGCKMKKKRQNREFS